MTVLLKGILPVFELDTYASPLKMMAVVQGGSQDEGVEMDYIAVVHRHVAECPRPLHVERMAFYEDARNAYAIVMTGKIHKYGNLLLRKGVSPIA